MTGAQASVGALKAVQGPVLLHVATHGFFLADQEDLPVMGTRSGRRNAELFGDLPAPALPQLGKDDPLLRSGLALAGANRQPDGRGVVTALEVAGLDLAGTQLAVLSACETGVGDIRNGEGVFGLHRALVLAGAQTQVMSLWKVDDAATRIRPTPRLVFGLRRDSYSAYAALWSWLVHRRRS
ncbi:MAG: CHAT domain-containing protein [Myxococcales bacterium]|nr:CHAT domain-containing protein [Myxococcales bacterium]